MLQFKQTVIYLCRPVSDRPRMAREDYRAKNCTMRCHATPTAAVFTVAG